LLILCRNGLDVTIRTSTEEWKPFINYCSDFGEKILEIQIKDNLKNKKDLYFTVKGVTEKIKNGIVLSNLYLQKNIDFIPTPYGKILTNEKHRGHIFVNGLMVTNDSNINLNYGYNINPEYINLNRDRRMINQFNLLWETSRMWGYLNDYTHLMEMIRKEYPDVKYLGSQKLEPKFCNNALHEFREFHGIHAIPASSQQDLAEMRQKYPTKVPVIVTEQEKDILERSPDFIEDKKTFESVKKTPEELLIELFYQIEEELSKTQKINFEYIIRLSQSWT